MRHERCELPGRGVLIRRVQEALHIAGCAVDAALRHAAQADAPHGRESNLEAGRFSASARPLVVRKVVAEAAMLLRCAAFLRDVDGQIKGAIDELAQRLVPSARGEWLLTALCLEPAFALDHSAAHIHLTALGYRDAAVDRLLTEIFEDESLVAPERLPNHDLEHQWLKSIWLEDDYTAPAALLARTCAAGPIDALAFRLHDIYAFTHVVLYASDMGRRAAQWPRPLRDVIGDVDAALAIAIDAENFDVAAELIWTWPMLRLPWSPAASFSFRVLSAVQDAHGFLPGPEYSDEERDSMPEDLRDEYVLRTSYHATLVMGFACAAALRASPNQLPVVTPPNKKGGAGDGLLCLLRNQTTEPRWRDVFSRLDCSDRDLLTEFVFAIALRRAQVSSDLALLRDTLSLGLHCDMIEHPIARQALTLLRRANLLGKISAARCVASA